MVTNIFLYTEPTSTYDDFVYSSWENTTSTFDNTISVHESDKNINVDVQKLYDENTELKEKIKTLELLLDYFKYYGKYYK